MIRMMTALLLSLSVAVHASDVKVPAFLWGSTEFFQPTADGDARRVSYQVRF